MRKRLRQCEIEREAIFTPGIANSEIKIDCISMVSDWITKFVGPRLYLYLVQTYCDLLNVNTRCKLGQRERVQ